MTLALWRNSPNLGAGLDLIACETRQLAVTGMVNHPIPEDTQGGEFKFLRVNSSDEFDHALNIGAGATGESTLVPSGRKIEFRRHFKFSSQATYCVVRVLGMNAYQTLQATSFTQDARGQLKNGDKKAFRARFGDGFLSGQLTGIEFFGVIRIEADSIERQLELAQKLQASCELGKAVVSTTFKERLSSNEHRISMAAYQKGGLVSVCDSPQDLMAMANDALDDWRHQRGYAFATEFDLYRASDSPSDTSPFMNIEPARQCLASLAQHAQHLETLLNDIDFVTRNMQWFENVNITELHLARRTVCNELSKVSELTRLCTTNPDNPQAYSPAYPQFEIPSRKHDSTATGICKRSLIPAQPPQQNEGFFPAIKYIRVGQFEPPCYGTRSSEKHTLE
jgi:hypothetical protein